MNLVQMLILIWWNYAASDVNLWDLYNITANTDIKWSNHHSISLIICLSAMRCKWPKHIMQCWRNKRSSEDVRWRSFSESKAPQKMLMIRFETKTWLMENQVKLSCFSKCSSGNMTAVILTFTWSKSVQIWQKKTREAAAEAGRFYNYTKRAFTGYTTKLSIRDRRHEGDWEWNNKVWSFRN